MASIHGDVTVVLQAGPGRAVKVQKGLHYKVCIAEGSANACDLQLADKPIASSPNLEDLYTPCQDASQCSATVAGKEVVGPPLAAGSVEEHGESDLLLSMAQGPADVRSALAMPGDALALTDPPLLTAMDATAPNHAASGGGRWAIAGLAGLLAVGAHGGGAAGPAPLEALARTVSGWVVAGPVQAGNDLEIDLYEADGNTVLLRHIAVDSNGYFHANVAPYSGVVFAKLVNQGNAVDYLDEASNALKDANMQLLAAGVLGQTATALALNVNALSTLAVDQLGADHSSAHVDAVNAAVARVFGLADLHQNPVVCTNGGSYNPVDGLSEGEKYGAVLASLSGMDQLNGGAAQATLDQLSGQINSAGTTLNFSGMTYDGTHALNGMGSGIGSSAGDVNGDGLSDFSISGSSGLSIPFVLYGSQDLSTLAGSPATSGTNQTGTTGADHFLGTVGDDTLQGAGGADVLYGGAGNDLLLVSDANFLRVDGGLGVDTLKLDADANGADLNFKLNALGGRIRGIECISMIAGGANTLTLTLQDILNQPNVPDTNLTSFNEAHMMVVSGGNLDHFVYSGPGTWTNVGTTSSLNIKTAMSAAGYDFNPGDSYKVYTHSGGLATLIVDSTMSITGL